MQEESKKHPKQYHSLISDQLEALKFWQMIKNWLTENPWENSISNFYEFWNINNLVWVAFFMVHQGNSHSKAFNNRKTDNKNNRSSNRNNNDNSNNNDLKRWTEWQIKKEKNLQHE